MSTKIPREKAEKEISGWLDHKKVSDSKRETQQDQIKVLVDALTDGLLVLREDKTFQQILQLPPDGEEPITELIFKPRMAIATIHLHLSGVKSTDVDGRLMAYVCALTSTSKNVIKKLDTEDYSVASSIAVFFA